VMVVALCVIAAAITCAPVFAVVVVSVASKREDRAWTLAGPPPAARGDGPAELSVGQGRMEGCPPGPQPGTERRHGCARPPGAAQPVPLARARIRWRGSAR
jgi:hypothetical protein